MRQKAKDRFKVLFICTGNTCRSPMAEGILKKAIEQNRVERLEVDSGGTHGLPCAPASLFAQQVARAHNVNLAGHRSRELTREMIEQADLILTMSPEHADRVRRIDRSAAEKTYLLKSFGRRKPVSNEDRDAGVLSIKDPMGGSLEDYERSFLEIEREIKRIFSELLRLAGKS
jgi:protein-tyrosine phosphatase